MKKCPSCTKENLNREIVCRYCGKPFAGEKVKIIRALRWGALALTILLPLVLYLLISHTSPPNPKTTQALAGRPSVEIISSVGYRALGGKMIVEGKVQNIGSNTLRGIQIMVSWHNPKGKLVASKTTPLGLISFDTLEIAPFRVEMPSQSQMEEYTIAFKDNTGQPIRMAPTTKSISP